MKPLSPAMLDLLREIARLGQVRWDYDRRTMTALRNRGLIACTNCSIGIMRHELRYTVTDLGRRVLAENPRRSC